MASDCPVIMGASPWKNVTQLFDEKQGRDTGRKIPKSLAEKGHACERSLFLLCTYDFPSWKFEWHEYDIIRSEEHPFMGATLDGEIETPDGRKGVLEIKTADVTRADAYAKWDDGHVPEVYEWQVAHQLIVTRADFALLFARLVRYGRDGGLPAVEERYYQFGLEWALERESEIVLAETRFKDSVRRNRRPSLVL